jgi:hypothetical protein
MRKTLMSLVWAVLLLVGLAAAGAAVVLTSQPAADWVARTSNDLLGWWVETALQITRNLRE